MTITKLKLTTNNKECTFTKDEDKENTDISNEEDEVLMNDEENLSNIE